METTGKFMSFVAMGLMVRADRQLDLLDHCEGDWKYAAPGQKL